MADDIDTLGSASWRSRSWQLLRGQPSLWGSVSAIREAIVDERWGDAVSEWIEVTDIPVDVYASGLEVWTADRFAEPDVAGLELRLQPLFEND